MNETDATIPMASPPISAAQGIQPQETLIQRGAFDPPSTPGTLGHLDRFDILRLLGEGGMGQVYLAKEPLTHTQVAIKIMRPETADDPLEVHRFLTEARHMYRLSHPHILRVLEVSDRSEGPYYVMPYIGGGSLLNQYKPGQPMPTEKIQTIAHQIAGALAHAHANGLIHRDIKPGNVLLDKEGNAYLTDFGLVRTVFNDSMVDTSASHLEGTAPYMSPAVARGEAEDTRCDIYAFGALLYELLSGKPPYTGRTPQMILDQILKGPPPPIRSANPKANAALVKIADDCMARELHERYATMSDVVADLERVAKGTAPLGVSQAGLRLPRLAAWAALLLLGVAGVAAFSVNALRSSREARQYEALAMAALLKEPQKDSAWQPTPAVSDGTDENRPILTADFANGSGGIETKTFQGNPTMGVLDEMFYASTNLFRVKIAEGMTRIGDSAFFGCSNLVEVAIPNSMVNIAPLAFAGCSSLTQLQIPGNVSSLGANAVIDCYQLTSIVVHASNPYFRSTPDGVVFNKDMTTLVWCPNGKTGSYEIPGGVTSIRKCAFQGCIGLTDVKIPNTVSDIGDWAFCIASNLTQIIIPDGVSRIGISTFVACRSLKTLTIPSGVTRIEEKAFRKCTGLTAVYFKGDVPQLADSNAFQDVPATLYRRPDAKGWGATFGGRPTAVWNESETPQTPASQSTASSLQPTASVPETDIHDFACIATNGALTIVKYTGEGGEVVIPATIKGLPVTTIGDAAFQKCENLTRLTIPDSVTRIGNNAFEHCTRLSSIAFSRDSQLTHIGDWAFHHCMGLSAFAFPSSTTTIGSRAFSCCFGFTLVEIPARVSSIGPHAFHNCTHMKAFHVDKENPMYFSEDGVLFDKAKKTLLHYPSAKEGEYAVPLGVTCIARWSFYDCNGVSRITIPATVAMIDFPSFETCRTLSEIFVDTANPLFSSADGILFDKEKNRLISCPGGGPETYEVPAGVKTIGVMAFGSASRLKSITLPESITALESAAFRSCENLTSLNFKGQAPSLGPDVFTDSNKATVYYRHGTTVWGEIFGGRPTKEWKP